MSDRIISRRRAERLPILDGMRGVAAIAVLVYHIGQITGTTAIAPFGFLAVDLFFMMSGVVISISYEPKLAAGLSARKFMLMRFGRLYPALLIGIIAGASVAIWQDRPINVWEVVGHLALIPQLQASQLYPLNPVLWSLFFEIVLNLAHAICARRITKRRLIVFTAVAGAAFALAIVRYRGSGLGFDGATLLPGLARACWSYGVGMLIARTRWRMPSWLAVVGIAAVIVLLFAPAIGPSAVRVGGMLFVLFSLATKGAVDLADVPAIQRGSEWLGGTSYPLYAVHYPLLLLAAPLVSGWAQWLLVCLFLILGAALIEAKYDAPIRRRLRSVFTRT